MLFWKGRFFWDRPHCLGSLAWDGGSRYIYQFPPSPNSTNEIYQPSKSGKWRVGRSVVSANIRHYFTWSVPGSKNRNCGNCWACRDSWVCKPWCEHEQLHQEQKKGGPQASWPSWILLHMLVAASLASASGSGASESPPCCFTPFLNLERDRERRLTVGEREPLCPVMLSLHGFLFWSAIKLRDWQFRIGPILKRIHSGH